MSPLARDDDESPTNSLIRRKARWTPTVLLEIQPNA